MNRESRSEAGFALIIALLALMLLTFLGLTLAMTTSTELQIATNYRWGQQALYNAEAGLDVARAILVRVGDGQLVLPDARAVTWDPSLTTAPAGPSPTARFMANRNFEGAPCDHWGNATGFGQVLVDPNNAANPLENVNQIFGQRLERRIHGLDPARAVRHGRPVPGQPGGREHHGHLRRHGALRHRPRRVPARQPRHPAPGERGLGEGGLRSEQARDDRHRLLRLRRLTEPAMNKVAETRLSGGGPVMSTWRRLIGRRPYALALAGGMLALLAGDRAHLAPPPGVGIDPFEVLDQQVRNNVLIVLDTSGSMKWPSDRDDWTLGADDPASRMAQAKAAIRAVVQTNQNRVNFGLVSYNIANLSKTINRGQNFEGDGRIDGPFIYVSADANAAPFYTPHTSNDDPATGGGENEACAAVDGFFCRPSNTFANYDGINSGDVWRSFMNRASTAFADPPTAADTKYDDPYPAGCTPGGGVLAPVNLTVPAAMRCRYYMQSRLLRNGTRYTWNRTSNNVTTRMTAQVAIPGGCPLPPAGLLGHSFPAPCYQLVDQATGNVSTFYYSSAIYENQAGNSCGGGALIASVAECNANNAALVLAKMDPELPVLPSGALNGVPVAPGNPTFDYADGHFDGDQTPDVGLRADQSTPLGGTLDFIRTVNPQAFPAGPVVASQRNFVILVTDGDDTCSDPGNLDHSAVLAGEAAERLYNNFNPNTGTGDFRHWAETFVVGFASAVNPARVNVIAQAGSGRNINNGAATPAAALAGAPCAPGANCRDAFFASNTQQLIDILNAALEQASNTGFFSATPSVFTSIPEYANTVPASPQFPAGFDVMDPDSRYVANATRAYRATFEAGTFRGKVTGFDSAGAMVGWEAGQRLIDPDRTSSDLATVDHTFAGLQGPMANVPAPAAGQPPGGFVNHIQRRIFTTRQNGRRLANISPNPSAADDLDGTTICSPAPCRLNLWPPDPTVAPGGPAYNNYTTPGSLDSRLFRKADGTQMTIADLTAAPWRACLGTAPAGHPCLSLTPAVRLAAAQKEMREMVLAFTAGAEPRRDNALNPVRDGTGQIVYRRRPFLLSESTIGTPSLVTQPLNITPTVHTPEYLLYRDGPRDNSGDAGANSEFFIRKGLGLRHPDRDGNEQPAGTQVRDALKPSMSMILVPSNDMLHAFRAGPCPGNVARCGNGALKERGSEELWAFVPHDLLPNLKDRMKAQTRQDHTYMISASLRTADVFVPGAGTLTINGKTYVTTGRWRRLLLFGRGMGGKYLTAMDITAIGSLTSPVLQTQLPAVIWNRGNPDTVDGLPGSSPQNGSPLDNTLYLDMGMTWSTPAVARVNPAFNAGREFVAYVGSGYSTIDDREGTRFYTLDPLNGDIVASDDVGDGNQTAFQNALVANPVIYAPERLVAGLDLPHPASPINEAAYIGDIHGRLWRFDSNDPGTRQLFRNLGPDQPMGVGPALLNLGAAHVFVETGADARVPAPAGGFRMFGFRDDGPPYPAGIPIPPLPAPEFGLSFPPPPAGKGDYRGTVQPLTAFDGPPGGPGTGVVFFTGTRFNPVAAGRCVSSFDTIIFGLIAETGGTAYATTEYEDAKAIGLPRPPRPPGPGDPPPFDQGTAPQGQEPEPPDPGTPSPGTKAVVKTISTRPASTVCR